MKIAEICEFYAPGGGGVRTYVDQKLECAARFGHDLTVIAPGEETRVEARTGGRIVWLKSPHLPFDRNYRMFTRAGEVWRVLDAERPDLVEASSPWRGGWIAAHWPGSAAKSLFMHIDPVAVYPHTFLDRYFARERIDSAFGWFWDYLRRLNGHFDATFVTGEWLAQRFLSFGLTHLHVTPFGIDRTKFSQRDRDENVRARMLRDCGLGPDASLLIAVSRHHPEKRLRTIIEAVTRAQMHRAIGLVIVGDGFIRRSVDRWAARARHIHVAGRISDQRRLATMLASADALLHGSAAETYGLVVAEAICAGTPIVVPDWGGSCELADPGFAEQYRTGDADSAARAVLKLLARDRNELSRACGAFSGARIGTVEVHFANLFATYEAVRQRAVERKLLSNDGRDAAAMAGADSAVPDLSGAR